MRQAVSREKRVEELGRAVKGGKPRPLLPQPLGQQGKWVGTGP